MTRRMAILVAVLVLGAVAVADVVVLKSGGRIEGFAETRGDQVYVESLAGQTHVPAESVASIDEEHRAPIEIYRERRDALGATPSLEDHLDLAAWLVENKGRRFVPEHVDAVLERLWSIQDPAVVLALAQRYEVRLGEMLRPIWSRLLQLDPDQENARRAFGFRRIGDRWVTEEEWQAAQGNVRFEGKWIPREMRDTVLEERKTKLRQRIRDVGLRESRIERREKAVEAGRKANERVERDLRRQAQNQARRESDLDDRERDIEGRERVLAGLSFCRTCRSYHGREHICPGLWTYCARCQGYLKRGHRCR